MLFGESSTFHRNTSPPFLGSKSKPSKKPAEAGGKPMKVVNTNIPVSSTARRLKGNIGKYAVVWSVTTRGEYREVRCSVERNDSRGI
jgi:hypothetical protein